MPARDRLDCVSCPVRERAACTVLDIDERAELARIGRRWRVASGETIFAAGDASDRCATLISGALKIASYGDDGVERILSLVHPSGFIGEMFEPVEHHHVIALTDSELCLFGRREYEAAIDRFPGLAKALLRRSAQDLIEARSLIVLQARRESRGRVAGFLLAMARAAGHSSCGIAERFDLALTRGEIAGLLGITIETVSRQLTALEKKGIIRRRGIRGIDVLDPALLEEQAA